MIPIGTDIPQRRTAWMNYFLIAANVVIYFASHSSSPRAVDGLTPGTFFIPVIGNVTWADLILRPGPTCHLYQFITYQFLHANLMHIAGNMVFLYVFGNNLNEKLGHLGYLAFYLAGGVFAGCGQLLTSPYPTLGASGSISAVTGLFFVLLPRTHIRILLFYVSMIEIPSMWFIAFCFVKDLAEPFFMGDNSVAHFAHLSGNLMGFLVGILLVSTHLIQRDHYDLWSLLTRWRRRREYLAVVSQGYDPFSHNANSAPPAQMLVTAAQKQADSRISFMRDLIFSLVRQHDLPAAAAKYLELLNIDSKQTMPPDIQLDIANQLYAEGKHTAAATAYEAYLSTYPAQEGADQIRLLLGVIYTHALPNPPRAKELLTAILPRLRDPAQRQMAESDLAYLTTIVPTS